MKKCDLDGDKITERTPKKNIPLIMDMEWTPGQWEAPSDLQTTVKREPGTQTDSPKEGF